MNEGLQGVEFHILNTDVQALNASQVPNKLAIGSKVTNGLGAGSDPGLGRQAALEDTERIIEVLEGADMVFVTAGLGGGHRHRSRARGGFARQGIERAHGSCGHQALRL